VSLVRRSPHTSAAELLEVRVGPLRKRQLRQVMAIEEQVYPKPWSPGVFRGEVVGMRDGSRAYVSATVGRHVVGYAGLLLQAGDGHVTNIAVDPAWQRHKIGSRLLLTLARVGIARGCQALTLEVRVSNQAAQAMYRRFGFQPAGVRARYYENTEDAIVMWAHDVDRPAFAERLAAIEAELPGRTIWEVQS
jgi:[ribosomal protein S18]-alanine N-acetyltransferase